MKVTPTIAANEARAIAKETRKMIEQIKRRTEGYDEDTVTHIADISKQWAKIILSDEKVYGWGVAIMRARYYMLSAFESGLISGKVVMIEKQLKELQKKKG